MEHDKRAGTTSLGRLTTVRRGARRGYADKPGPGCRGEGGKRTLRLAEVDLKGGRGKRDRARAGSIGGQWL